MDGLLDHPAVQAGVAPFLVALIVGVALRRTPLLGLSIIAAFAVVASLAVGYSFESITATRKLVLIGLGSGILLLALDLAAVRPAVVLTSALSIMLAAAVIWMLWRVLERQPAFEALLHGLGAVGYTLLMVESTLRMSVSGIRSTATSMVLGLCAGALAMLSASLVLCEVGVAVAAGAGAVLLIQLGQQAKRGVAAWTLSLAAAVIASLVGLLAVFTGTLPWFSLVPTLAIPWAAGLVRPDRYPLPVAALLTTAACMIPALMAAGLTWSSGAPT